MGLVFTDKRKQKVRIGICSASEIDRKRMKEFCAEYFRAANLQCEITTLETQKEFLLSEATKDFHIVFLNLRTNGRGDIDKSIMAGREFFKMYTKGRLIYILNKEDVISELLEFMVHNAHPFMLIERPLSQENVNETLDEIMEYLLACGQKKGSGSL